MKILLSRLISVCVSLFILSIAFVNLAEGEIAREAVVGLWLFDSENGGNLAIDSSGNGHDGVVKDGVNWVVGKFGNALEFPGLSASYVEIPPVESLDLSTFTITAWVKMEMVPDKYPVIVAKFGAQRNYGIAIQKTSETPYLQFHTNGEYKEVRATTKITDKVWHHVAATYDMQSMKFYVDGVLEAENAVNGQPNTVSDSPLSFGGGPGTSPAHGIIDEIGIFNVGLTGDDINNIMIDGLGRTFIITPVSASGKLATLWSKVKAQ